jgi:hypothetical protein
MDKYGNAFGLGQVQSQSPNRATPVGSRSHQIAKGRRLDGPCFHGLILIGPFQTTIEKPNSS